MSDIVRRLLAKSTVWGVFADVPALGAGFLVVLAFRPGWCGAEPVHIVPALIAVVTAVSSGPCGERSVRNIALLTAMTAATAAAAVAAAALATGCTGLSAWLGWHPAIPQGIVVIVVSVAGRVAYHWAALRLGMAAEPDDCPGGQQSGGLDAAAEKEPRP